jgi:hypothetical protein
MIRNRIQILMTLSLLLFLSVFSHGVSGTRQTFALGQVHEKPVHAVVETRQQQGEPEGIVDVQVYYRIGSRKQGRKTNALQTWESYAGEVKAGAYAFTGARHKQLFVSTTLGQVCTRIYDLSGEQIKPIYSLGGGRVIVKPRRNAAEGYDLEESWPKRQWDDHPDLQGGVYNPRTGTVTRILRWNGKQFVPQHANIPK